MAMPVGKKSRAGSGFAGSGPKGGGKSVGAPGKLQAHSRLAQIAAKRGMEGPRNLWSALPLGSSTFYLQLAEVRERREQLVETAQERQAVVAHAGVLVHDQHRVEEGVDRGPELGQ